MSNTPTENTNPFWAIVELMGHAKTAGRVSIAGNLGGLLRVDVPQGETYRTEFYGIPAIYGIRMVSEEIARACVPENPAILPFIAPVITLAKHNAQIKALRAGEEAEDEFEEEG
jgi:hypothetical protein